MEQLERQDGISPVVLIYSHYIFWTLKTQTSFMYTDSISIKNKIPAYPPKKTI